MKALIASLCIGLSASLCAGAAPAGAPSPGGQDPAKEVKRGSDALRRGDYDDAADHFERALAAQADSVDARLGLSLAFLKVRRYRSAVEQAVKVLDGEPAHARANALVGTVLMRVGALPEAVDYFGRALAADDREPLALAGLAEMDLYKGDLRESLRRVRLAVARSPRDPDFQYLLAQCSARQELYPEAAEAYERYLEYASDLDDDRRDRVRGLIAFYRRLAGRTLYVVTGSRSADLPMEFGESRLPFVEVKVNGQGPFRFCIDTGAGFVVVSKRLSERLDLRPIASGGTSRGVSGTGKFPIVYGIIDKLSMGEVTMQNVPTYIRDIRRDDREPIDGYIGLSVLAQFRTAVDLDRGTLELRPRAEPAEPLGPHDVEVPYRITNGGMLSVVVDIGKQVPLNFIVDTGASSTVVSQRAFERFDLHEKQHKGVSVRVVGAGGVTEAAPVVVLDRLALHGVPQAREFVRAVVLDLEPVNEAAGFEQAGILGNDVLRFYRVEFDFDRGSIVLRPHERRGGATAHAADGEGVS